MFAIIDEQSAIEGHTTIQASMGLQNIREVNALYSEWWTGDVAWKMQVSGQLLTCYTKYWHWARVNYLKVLLF